MSVQIVVALCLLLFPTLSLQAAPPSNEIHGYVWHDRNENGQRDAGEPPLANVLLALADSKGAILVHTSTDTMGAYRLTGLRAGSYYLSETDPEGYLSTTPNLIALQLVEGHSIERHFGDVLALPGCFRLIDGYIWHDTDADGARGTDEPRLAGIPVRILDLEQRLAGLTLSNIHGAYTVRSLDPAQYYVILDAPASAPFSRMPLYWGVDLRSCYPVGVDIGLQQQAEATWACDVAGDRVGPINGVPTPDGLADGNIRLWLNTDAPLRVEGLTVEVEYEGLTRRWDTDPASDAWTLGVTDVETGALLNPATIWRQTISRHTAFHLLLGDSAQTPALVPGAEVRVAIQLDGHALLATSLTIPSCADAQAAPTSVGNGNSVVSGTVYRIMSGEASTGAQRIPATGILLTLTEANGRVVAEQYTNAQGRYRFEGLGWAPYYLLQGPIPGYEPVLSGYWGIAATDGSEVIIDLENQLLPAAQVVQVSLPLVRNLADY